MPYHQLVEMTKIIQLSLPYYHAYQAACKLFTWSLKYPDVFVTSGALGEVMNIPPHHPILCCDLINWWSTLCIVVSYRMIGMRSALLGLLKSRALKKPGPGLLEMQPNKGLCTFIPLLETFRLPNFSLSYLQCQLEHPCSEVNTSLIHYCEYNYNLYLIGLKPKIQLNLDLDGCFTSFLKDKIK